jgi:purine-cytosine permease-like protein
MCWKSSPVEASLNAVKTTLLGAGRILLDSNPVLEEISQINNTINGTIQGTILSAYLLLNIASSELSLFLDFLKVIVIRCLIFVEVFLADYFVNRANSDVIMYVYPKQADAGNSVELAKIIALLLE